MKTVLLTFVLAMACLAEGAHPLILRTPALNKTHIVFSYAGDLWSVPREGGDAVRLTAGPGVEINPVFSPDGARLAYMPLAPAFAAWKRYRGGTTTPIWIANLSDAHVEKIPRENSNDFNPMWVGKKVYFLSDRN